MEEKTNSFIPFSPDHLTVLFLTAAVVVMLIAYRNYLHADRDLRFRWGIAAVLIGNEIVSWIIGLMQGKLRLPLQLCDVALALTALALFKLQPSVCEVAYFFGLAGSVQAILTPDLREPFPTYWWIKFFVGHCGVVFSVIYLALTGRVKPTACSIWRVWCLANAYALIAGLINWLFGTNLGYLAHKSSHPSLLDSFGPWPYYILAMELAAAASFALYYAPFVISRRWLRHAT